MFISSSSDQVSGSRPSNGAGAGFLESEIPKWSPYNTIIGFVYTRCLQIIKEFFYGLISVVRSSKISINRFIRCIYTREGIIFLVIFKGEMVGQGDVFSIKGLLKLFQVLG